MVQDKQWTHRKFTVVYCPKDLNQWHPSSKPKSKHMELKSPYLSCCRERKRVEWEWVRGLNHWALKREGEMVCPCSLGIVALPLIRTEAQAYPLRELPIQRHLQVMCTASSPSLSQVIWIFFISCSSFFFVNFQKRSPSKSSSLKAHLILSIHFTHPTLGASLISPKDN